MKTKQYKDHIIIDKEGMIINGKRLKLDMKTDKWSEQEKADFAKIFADEMDNALFEYLKDWKPAK